MPALRRRLTPGEDLVVDVRPHWSCLAAPVSFLAAVIAGAVTTLVEGAPAWADWPVLLVLVLAALWLLARYIRWVTTRLVLTTTRIIERRGVLARTSREIPLGAITELGVRRNFFERIIGTGDLLVESAGRDGVEVFADLPRPALILDQVDARMAEWRRPAPTPGPGTASIPEQIDHLDQLRRRGAITQEEFERTKTQLLDRL